MKKTRHEMITELLAVAHDLGAEASERELMNTNLLALDDQSLETIYEETVGDGFVEVP